MATAESHEFLIQCQNGEIVFVPSNQGKAIKTRCRHFRYLLGLGISTPPSSASTTNGGESTKKSSDDYVQGRIVKKESWNIGTARHIIELLTQGTTWIPNDSKRFEALKGACAEIDMPGLCLGSMINYHDILDQASTLKFFDLASATHKYQFQFYGVVQSWQWIHLLHKGILLLPKRKSQQILMLTVAPPTDGTTELPTSAKSPNIVTKLGGKPNQQRLAKCDELCSEFSVFNGASTGSSKIQSLLLILDVLSRGRKHTNRNIANVGGNTNVKEPKKVPRQPVSGFTEEYKIVYKNLIGGLDEEDLNMMWRLTSASYTIAVPEEEQYLVEPRRILGPRIHHDLDGTSHTKVTESSSTASSTSQAEDASSVHSTSTSSDPHNHVHVRFDGDCHYGPHRYQTRTLTSTSFMILRHLFEPVNTSTIVEGDGGQLSANRHHRHLRSHLPASLILYDLSPDTIGRFLNSVATVNAMNTPGPTITDIGWDFYVPKHLQQLSSPPKASFLFYFGGTSDQVHQVLDLLSDYSRSAIVEGLGDFKFNQCV
jgi:hypothetical protein